MKMVKSLILGSAAGLIAMSGAQAADLPVKAKAVEYVKVCSLYGAGFWYIPGTDTCIRIGGAIRLDTAFNGGSYDVPFLQGGAGGNNLWTKNYYTTRERFNLTEDTRTATEYGVVRTYANIQFDFLQGRENISGGFTEVDYAFIQFAGFTFGKAVSQFDPQWTLARPNISSGYFNGSNDATGIPQIAYTATFGNGVSGTLSLEDAQPYRTAGVYNTSGFILAPGASAFLTTTYGSAPNGSANSFLGNASGGDHIPDIVGNLRLDQAWGTLHFAAAAHNIDTGYYGANVQSGHPDDTWGWAVTGGISLTQLPTGAGDRFLAEATYAEGAAKYVFGGTVDTQGGGRFSRVNGSSLGFGYILDGVFSPTGAGSVQESKAWEVDAAFEHYWTPQWRTSVFGSYSTISYGSSGDALLAAAFTGPASRLGVQSASTAAISAITAGFLTPGAGGLGSFQMDLTEIGTKTSWTPVKDLTLSAEFIYSRLGNHLNGTYTSVTGASPGSTVAGQTFTLGSQNTYNGAVQILRSF
jgi:Porin subfamily